MVYGLWFMVYGLWFMVYGKYFFLFEFEFVFVLFVNLNKFPFIHWLSSEIVKFVSGATLASVGL